MTDPLMYSVEEAARSTGLGRTKIYELVAEGKIATVKVGRRRLVPAEALRDFVDGLVATADDRTPDAVA